MAQKNIKYKRSYKRVVIIGIVLVLLCAIAFAYHLIAQQKTAQGKEHAADKYTIMVMGIDSRADDVGRSDTMMLFNVDKVNDKVSVMSLPRDTRVKIDGHGYDKLNHAYSFGGHELSKKTVEDLLDTPVDYYMLIDIKAFENIIDAIGGIDINVEKRMYYDDPWDDNGGLHIDIYPGMQHMDGKKAIEYVRFRDGEGDIGRIARQQHFIKAVLEKVLTPTILPKLPDIAREVSDSVKTDMSFADMLKFIGIVPKLKDNPITSSMLPGSPAYINDVSYWLPDIKKLREDVASMLGIDMTQAMQDNADTAAEDYKESLPKGLKVLNDANTDVADTNANEDKKDSAPVKPQDITVMVINSSGIDGAGASAADSLMKRGFKVSSVETGRSSANEKTKLTTNANAVNLFYGMPFPCVIMTAGGGEKQAVLNIGHDFKK